MRSQIFPAIAALAMLATIIPAGAAQAYIGPALGLGMLGAGFGVLMTSASAIFYSVRALGPAGLQAADPFRHAKRRAGCGGFAK